MMKCCNDVNVIADIEYLVCFRNLLVETRLVQRSSRIFEFIVSYERIDHDEHVMCAKFKGQFLPVRYLF